MGLSLKAPARLDAIELAVDVDLQKDLRAIRGPAGISWDDAIKTQRGQVELIGEDIDYAHRNGIADVVVEALGK